MGARATRFENHTRMDLMAETNDEREQTSDDPTLSGESPPADSRGMPKRLRGTRLTQDEVPPTAPSRTWPARQEQALERARMCAGLPTTTGGETSSCWT